MKHTDTRAARVEKGRIYLLRARDATQKTFRMCSTIMQG